MVWAKLGVVGGVLTPGHRRGLPLGCLLALSWPLGPLIKLTWVVIKLALVLVLAVPRVLLRLARGPRR